MFFNKIRLQVIPHCDANQIILQSVIFFIVTIRTGCSPELLEHCIKPLVAGFLKIKDLELSEVKNHDHAYGKWSGGGPSEGIPKSHTDG